MTPEQQKEFHNSILSDLRNKTYLEVSLPIYFDYFVKDGIISDNLSTYSQIERAVESLKTKYESQVIRSTNRSEYQKIKEFKIKIIELDNGTFNKNEVLYEAKILFMQKIDLNELELKLK